VTIYAVNGKEPIYAWIPSLDTAGNGTTTLSDLVSNRPGTLTNMDAATDWVADTDAGGVRALDFDGVNDFVGTAGNLTIGTICAVSFWMKVPDFSTTAIILELSDNYNTTSGFLIRTGGNQVVFTYTHTPSIDTTFYVGGTIPGQSVNVWNHYVFVMERGTPSMANLRAFVNGAAATVTQNILTATANTASFSVQPLRMMARFGAAFPRSGRLDDMRMFGQDLVLADAQYLYKNGDGRGRLPGGGIIPILRQYYAAQVAR
jgi:hypothetical protein